MTQGASQSVNQDVSQADVQAAFCAVLCDEWARSGITDAVVSPGSRSTPMVASLDAQERIRVTVVLDERSAGFVALGASLAGGRPVLAVTTSGTAAVEMHPAVVEASQAGIALIVITTDRPPELHRVGAPQTVDQHGIYAGATRWAFDPGVADLASAGMWRSLASRCVAEAVGGSGPVHLNLAFREPLVGSADRIAVPEGRPGHRPWHASAAEPRSTLCSEVVASLKDLIEAGSEPSQQDHHPKPSSRRRLLTRGLIVAGEGAASSEAERAELLYAAERLRWPVLADPRSGLRVTHPLVVASADQLLRCQPISRVEPDVVMRLGAPWASKVLNSWLGALNDDIPQVLVDGRGRWADPDRKAWKVLTASPQALLGALADLTTAAGQQPDDAWAATWRHADDIAAQVLDSVLGAGGDLELSEPAIARACLAALPDEGILFASSSMPVRDVEWYGAARSSVRVLSNRGANGIDGVLSSALGAGLASGRRPVLALIGDLAFLYDAGALLWAARREVNLSVLVVDNDGGGIFSFLPYADSMPTERFERYWGTPHGVDLVALATVYGVAAEKIASRQSLDSFLSGMDGNSGLRVGVVRSDRKANFADHERISQEIKVALAARLPIS